MKFFLAALGTETNSFSPLATGAAAFAEDTGIDAYLGRWARMALVEGHEVATGLAAYAQPGGPTPRNVYEDLREEMLRRLRAALPVQAVLLLLHGAMIADGYRDCEGDLLAAVRGLVGKNVTVGGVLDLHCHLSAQMMAHADILLSYQEYPHCDIAGRMAQLYELCAAAAAGLIRPVMAAHDCRMLGLWPTTAGPLRAFVGCLREVERQDGVLAASFIHGFPWGDTADTGARMLVVTDRDGDRASLLAQELGEEVWALREHLGPAYLSIDEALDRALGTDGLAVLADVADNPDAGAPADATFVLRRILERSLSGVLSALYWDPLSAQQCCEAGPGAGLDLLLGGQTGPLSGPPLDVRVRVRAVASPEAGWPYGQVAWVSAEGVDLLLGTRRRALLHPAALVPLGLDPTGYRMVVLKSAHHFQAGFAPLASAIFHVAAPGVASPDLARLPYRHLRRPMWPIDH